MTIFRQGHVREVTEREDMIEAQVEMDDRSIMSCTGWPSMLGVIRHGDRVIVNTLGVEMGLGTGGAGFILWNVDGAGPSSPPEGHVVKMRYTPWQKAVLAVEAPESEWHEDIAAADDVAGMPVVAATLHSQIPSIAAGVKAARSDLRVGYLMTDGAALPLWWSHTISSARELGLLAVTATAGHAFGGELEAVNIFSGLIALRVVGDCDVAVVGMGPGVVGTGTRWGTSALEQGQVLDAAAALGGQGIAALRLSFADDRVRHRGISHHSISVLGRVAREAATVVVPLLPADQRDLVHRQLDEAGIGSRHELVEAAGEPGVATLREIGLLPSSMGRTFDEELALSLAGAAAGRVAAERA